MGFPVHLTDLVARARARALLQYKSLAKYMADVDVLTGEVQQLEDAFWAMYQQIDLDTAIGIWLDRLGGLIGALREGADDNTFRALAQARVLANRSTGSTDDLIQVVLTANQGGTLELVDWYPAAQALTLNDPLFTIDGGAKFALQITRLLGVARAVAVQTMFLWQQNDDSEMFVYGDALGSDPTGSGFGDATNPATGGEYAGALNS